MKKGIRNLAMWLVLIILAVVIFSAAMNNASTQMNYSELISNIASEKVEKIVLSADGTTAEVTLADDNIIKEVTIPSVDNLMEHINDKMLNGTIELDKEETSIIYTLLSVFSPVLILIVFLIFWVILMNPNQGGKNSSMSFGKSKARMINNNDKTKVTFKDVAGVDEEKEELEEIVYLLVNQVQVKLYLQKLLQVKQEFHSL